MATSGDTWHHTTCLWRVRALPISCSLVVCPADDPVMPDVGLVVAVGGVDVLLIPGGGFTKWWT